MKSMDPHGGFKVPPRLLEEFVRQLYRPGPPRILTSSTMVRQYRFPRSKRRRIRAKWAKRPQNFRPMENAFFVKDLNVVYCHPEFAAKLAAGGLVF